MTTLQEIIIPPLAVVCHDAGAANLIVHWIKGYQGDVLVCMEGPAKIIWNSHFSEVELLPMRQVIKGVNTLLSGTGWGDLEYHARIEAKKRNIYNIAVIDHWTAYKERFIRNENEVLPDLILVGDKYAKNKACIYFPTTPIIQLPNLYLQLESERAYLSRIRGCQTPIEHILIITEPSKQKIRGENSSLEFIAIEYFMLNLNKINLSNKKVKIHLRPHPSESPDKYNFLRLKYLAAEIKISTHNKLYKDIAWADLVVGMNSFAMVVALSSKVPTISILPPEAGGCVLPYPEILYLRDM